jgi:hypothetical protein
VNSSPNEIRRRAEIGGAILLVALVTPALAAVGSASDYAVHARLAAELAETGRASLPIPAPLFAWLVAAVLRIAPASEPLAAALAIGLASHLACYAVLLGRVQAGAASGGRGAAAPHPALQAAAIALCVGLAAPVPFASAAQSNYYLGYIGLATYHNPTIALLRPLAMLLLASAAAQLESPRSRSLATGVALATLASAAALAKPSFSVALLPALAVAVALLPTGSRLPSARLLLLAVALPSAAALGFEYGDGFRAGGDSGLRLAPFEAFRAGSPGSLPLKLLLSALFPLGALLCSPRRALADPALRLAWLCAAAGLAIALLLAETGPRAAHGNFVWSAQIGLFVLFAESARWVFARDTRDLGRRRRALCAGLLALHALCGLVWLAIHWLPLFDPNARPLREWF